MTAKASAATSNARRWGVAIVFSITLGGIWLAAGSQGCQVFPLSDRCIEMAAKKAANILTLNWGEGWLFKYQQLVAGGLAFGAGWFVWASAKMTSRDADASYRRDRKEKLESLFARTQADIERAAFCSWENFSVKLQYLEVARKTAEELCALSPGIGVWCIINIDACTRFIKTSPATGPVNVQLVAVGRFLAYANVGDDGHYVFTPLGTHHLVEIKDLNRCADPVAPGLLETHFSDSNQS